MSRNWKLAVLLLAITAAMLWVLPWQATAADGSQAQAGLALSRQYCEECHLVVRGDRQGWTDAPSFEAIANDPRQSRAKLVAYIQQPHMHMLNTGRPAGEANQIAVYILSLRKQ